MKTIKFRLASLLVVALSMVGLTGLALATPAFEGTAHAQALNEARKGANSTGSASENDVPRLVKNVINILSWIVGVASVIMIVIGGLKYVTSNGDSGGIASAKNTIIYAIVGLVIAIFAQAIVQFVIGKVD